MTVFTDTDGRFRFPSNVSVSKPGATLEVRKLGFRVRDAADGKIPVDARASGQSKKITIEVETVSNIADTAPASAWLSDQRESDAKHLINLHCSGCHQFPSDKARGYARLLEEESAPAGSNAKALEEWRKLVRREGWRAAMKYMRAKVFSIFPDKTALRLEDIPWPMVQGEALSLFTDEQAEIMAHYLAEHFPADTSILTPDGYSPGAPLGVTPKTVIREYALPNTSLVREAIMVRNSPYIWGADLKKNRLLRLDPRNGEKKWYPVPYDNGATGPHTIVGDADGNVWLSMIENDQFGRFDPRKETWKLWTLSPGNLGSKNTLSGQAAVHDMTIGAEGELARDPEGRIWLTLVSINKMASVNPGTGKVSFYDAPPVPGMSPANASLYGTILSADGGCAWFTQLNGYFGCMNTKTPKPESLVSFPPGTGPRRLARDRNDTIWIPLYGAGQIAKYDGRNRRMLATYDLPDRRAAPYAAVWDERRQALWVTTSNADVLYRFDPKTERFAIYPLPRRQAYMRQLSIDPSSGHLVGSYGNIPVGSGPSMAFVIDLGD